MQISSPVLSLHNIYKSFGKTEVLKGISLSADSGEVVSILGRSGAGKSTMLRCINLLDPPDAGEVRVGDTQVLISAKKSRQYTSDAKNVLELRRKIGMVFQSFHLWNHMTVLENIIEAPVTVLKRNKKEAVDQARTLLAKVDLVGLENRYPSELSGGQQQRVAIARALAVDPQLLLFDEPTSALDPELVQEVLNVIEELAAEGRTMLIVTHEIAFAREVSTQLVFLDNGRIKEQGPPKEVIGSPKTEQCRTFLAQQYR